VVSYLGDGAIVSDITQTSNTCTDSYHARGFSVVGGRDIVIRDGRVEGTRAAGIYLASEDSFDTYAAQRVQVVGNHISGANTDPEIDHGAIFSAGRPGTGDLDGEPVSLENEDLLLAGNVIEGTVSGRANIVVANGHHRRVAIEGARITGRPGIAAVELDDLAPDRYRLEANTFNGAALPDHAGPEPRPAR